jgi:hypothetical protein
MASETRPETAADAVPETMRADQPTTLTLEAAEAEARTAFRDTPKQAVVVVHGIGEQRPLETLRSFVQTVYQRDLTLTNPHPQYRVVDPDLGELNRVWLVPDNATGTVELRRIATPGNKRGVRTDFFEFYWADIMEGTPAELAVGWVRGLLLRSPFRLPRYRKPKTQGAPATPKAPGRFSPPTPGLPSWIRAAAAARVWIAWVLLWIFAVVFVVLSIAVLEPTKGIFASLVAVTVAWLRDIRVWLSLAAVAFGVVVLFARFFSLPVRRWRRLSRLKLGVPLVAIAIGALAYYFLQNAAAANPRLWAAAFAAIVAAISHRVLGPYVGDIVRYVRATPSTVAKRKEVRERGLKLLRELHEAKDNGRHVYDRIVVVGHSLGSIIAYDLLQYFWEERGPTHHKPAPDARVQKALAALDVFVQKHWPEEFGPERPDGLDVVAYQRLQHDVFDALVASDQGWRISDLVTLGSPLVHSEFLIADDRDQLDREFVDRLVSSSPPRPNWPSPSMLYRSGGSKGPFVHFAAPFAAVRWTNLYDVHTLPLFGDIVSGPVQDVFGSGILERQVAMRHPGRPGVLGRLFTHTLYWEWPAGLPSTAQDVPEQIVLLRAALDLK